jgi:hypothetical protein
MNITELTVDGTKMYVCDSSAEGNRAMIGQDAPHSHYAIRRHEIHAELAAFKRIVERVSRIKSASDRVESVVELFGGSGWHSMLIQKHCKPISHLALDIHEDCVASIKRSLPQVQSKVADSYAFIGKQDKLTWDWVHADFNQLTFKRYLAETRYKDAVDSIFKASREWVTLTDSAIFGLVRFQKNRESYAKAIGMAVDEWQDYFRAIAQKYKEKYDFGTVAVVTWHRMSSMLLLKRGADVEFGIEEVRDKVPVRIIKTSKED